METYLPVLALTIIGIVLLLGAWAFFFPPRKRKPPAPRPAPAARPAPPAPAAAQVEKPGQPCPVCGAPLREGEMVKSTVFPSFDGKERLMRIQGCGYCLGGGRERMCPVCGEALAAGEVLIARMFERPGKRHVHVLGCSRCRKP